MIVQGNHATSTTPANLNGGGIYSHNGTYLTIVNSTIRNNEVYGVSGSSLVNRSEFFGAGIRHTGFELQITGSVISNNVTCDQDLGTPRVCDPMDGSEAEYRGGGIHAGPYSLITISQSTIDGNRVYAIDPGNSVFRGEGGGIFVNCESTDEEKPLCLEITQSTVSRNAIYVEGEVLSSLENGDTSSAHGDGISVEGGLDYDHDPPAEGFRQVWIENTTIASNTIATAITGDGCPTQCRHNGGGIWTKWLAEELRWVTIANNSVDSANGDAPASAGGLTVGSIHSDSYVFLYNTIVAGNTADAGEPQNIMDGIDSLSYNLFGDNDFDCYGGGLPPPCGDDQFNLDPELQPLGNYGGPTETMRPFAGSPAINMGDPTPDDEPASDQRGYDRSVNTTDVGVVECQAELDCVNEGDSPAPPFDDDGQEDMGGDDVNSSLGLQPTDIDGQQPASVPAIPARTLPARRSAAVALDAVPLVLWNDPLAGILNSR